MMKFIELTLAYHQITSTRTRVTTSFFLRHPQDKFMTINSHFNIFNSTSKQYNRRLHLPSSFIFTSFVKLLLINNRIFAQEVIGKAKVITLVQTIIKLQLR